MRRSWGDTNVAEAWGEWVAGMGEWHLFGGLTYDPARVLVGSHGQERGQPHPEAVQKHLRGWLRESERRVGRPIEAAIIAVEAHKSGWPHAHPLLRLAGGLQPGDVVALGTTWFERRGYARLEAPRDVADVAAYAAKYLAKDLDVGDVLLWPTRGRLDVHQEQLLPARRARGSSLNRPTAASRRHG